MQCIGTKTRKKRYRTIEERFGRSFVGNSEATNTPAEYADRATCPAQLFRPMAEEVRVRFYPKALDDPLRELNTGCPMERASQDVGRTVEELLPVTVEYGSFHGCFGVGSKFRVSSSVKIFMYRQIILLK